MSGLQVHMNAAPGGRDAIIAKVKAETEKAGRKYIREPDKTLQQGCATTLVAALDPSVEPQNGAYLWNGNVREDQTWTNEDDQEKLWALSEKLTGEKFEL
jgi:hypothetical protein